MPEWNDLPLIARLLRRFRGRRMRVFAAEFQITSETRVLDVGGTPSIWALLPVKPRITFLNMPQGIGSCAGFDFVFASGCEMPFPDQSFEIVFSNSVIEHVGDGEQQRRFRGRSSPCWKTILRADTESPIPHRAASVDAVRALAAAILAARDRAALYHLAMDRTAQRGSPCLLHRTLPARYTIAGSRRSFSTVPRRGDPKGALDGADEVADCSEKSR